VFEALFAKVGTLLDATKGTESIPHLINLLRRQDDSPLKPLLSSVQSRLSAKDGPFAKVKAWRHQIVAHRTPSISDDTFYSANPMKLADVEEMLIEAEKLVNTLSVSVLAVRNDTRTGSTALIQEGIDLFTALSGGMESKDEGKQGLSR
jgi:hypothetical protein